MYGLTHGIFDALSVLKCDRSISSVILKVSLVTVYYETMRKGYNTYTSGMASEICELLDQKKDAKSPKRIRQTLRNKYGFFSDDYFRVKDGFTSVHFDQCVKDGRITIVD